jgi:hypothetical protein
MDLHDAIRDLQEERDKLTQLIGALEEFKRTGSLPRPSRRGRKTMGEDERKNVSERMKKYWEERKAREPAAGQG